MRLIELPTLWTVILDILAWLVIHLGVVALMIRVPGDRFHPEGPLYRPRAWERAGRLYERVFRIRSWKERVPDGAGLWRDRGFPKRRLARRDASYMKAFCVETCRAELTHWVIILFAPLFFFWNKTGVGWIMIGYALAENLPLIMVQRYNRLRFARVLEKRRKDF